MEYDKRLIAKLAPSHVAAKARVEASRAFAPLLLRRSPLRRQTFDLWSERHSYHLHRHNLTWRNERAVELSVAARFVERAQGDGLEFGNVLGHYGYGGWPVVDKFERAAGVTNIDIIDYQPGRTFDWIVSVSTLEHVGWDEQPRDPGKLLRAFDHLRSLLSPAGRMLITAPLGYNPTLDEAVAAGLPVERQAVLHRVEGGWREGGQPWPPYREDGRGADCVWLAEVAH